MMECARKNVQIIVLSILLLGICSVKADVIDTIGGISHLLYGIVAGIAALMITLHGIKWKTASSPADREEAKRGIINVILGLIIIIIAASIVGMIYKVPEEANPPNPPGVDCDPLDGWYVKKGLGATCIEGKLCTNTLEKEEREYFESGGKCEYSVTNSKTECNEVLVDCPAGEECVNGLCVPSGSLSTTTTKPSTTSTVGGATTSSTTTTQATTTTFTARVLIAALKSNMQTVYSDTQISGLEGRIKDYQAALQNDGLGSLFLYLDEDETSDIIGSKVTNPADWNNVDGILDQVTEKLPIDYVLIVGGYDRFPCGRITVNDFMGTTAILPTDMVYADNNRDAGTIPDVALGRLPDSGSGDMALLMAQFENAAGLHDSGGLVLSPHVGRAGGPGSAAMCFWDMLFSKTCSSDANCMESTSDARIAASGKDFFFMVQHGEGGPPQEYVNALKPIDLGVMDLSGAVWMMVPCYGGAIDYSSTGDSIVLTFLKNGGAIHMGSLGANCCSHGSTGCTEKIDYMDGSGGGVGLLYYRIAKKFSAGKRIGDAYLEGKTEYKMEFGSGCLGEFYHNCMYGDPTLKIKAMW